MEDAGTLVAAVVRLSRAMTEEQAEMAYAVNDNEKMTPLLKFVEPRSLRLILLPRMLQQLQPMKVEQLCAVADEVEPVE